MQLTTEQRASIQTMIDNGEPMTDVVDTIEDYLAHNGPVDSDEDGWQNLFEQADHIAASFQ